MTTHDNDIRRHVTEAWAEVLGGERNFSDDDDFVDLGGHSILALHVADDLERRLGRPVAVRTLLSTTRLGDLVTAL